MGTDPRIAIVQDWFERGHQSGRLEYAELLATLDAARERPSALDVETDDDPAFMVLHNAGRHDISCRWNSPGAYDAETSPCTCGLADDLRAVAEYARLTEPDAGEGTTLDDAMRTYRTHVEAYEATRNPAFREDARRAIGFDYSGPDTTEATPLPSDAGPYYGPVVRTTPWRDVRVDHAEHTHATPDTTEATLRDARHPCPCGRRTVEIAPGIGICERDHVWDGYVGLTKRAEVALAVALRAALQQPAVHPVTHGRHCPCSSCAREDWTNPELAHCGMHGPSCPREYAPPGWSDTWAAVQPERGPE